MKRVVINILILFFVSFFIQSGTIGFAQDENGSKEDSVDGLSQTITLDADDAFLPSILTILAQKSGYNIVTGPGVSDKQRVSIHLKDTPISEAVNLVVRAAGLSYEVVGTSFLVGSFETLSKEEVGLNSHVIELQFADAYDTREMLEDLTQNIQVDPSGNRLIIRTSPKIIDEVRKVVRLVDQPSMQIMLDTRIIEVSGGNLEEYGIDWERLNHITSIWVETPLDYVTEVDDNGTVRRRSQSGTGRDPEDQDFGGQTPELDKLPEKYTFQQLDGFSDIGYFSRQLEAFDITLDYMLQNNKAKLLANTSLVTMNNREASLHIGEVIPFIVTSQDEVMIERERVGTMLKVTPKVNTDGYITTTIEPEVSSVIELINGEIPRTKVRTAKTTVIVKDGQRIIIGGLISSQERETMNSIPLLSRIPFIGKFFTHKDFETRETDLLIEITPHILHDGRAAKGVKSTLERGMYYDEMRKSLDNEEEKEELK
ncbi:MAG: hypothetical protein B6244_09150 [Candidatus Cloacimonetes bacterium 4572_55]|nr:MAG: hypothetical protein B6244_09150 [Candidatus Cloacimonetes bacterium 4572_55]